MTHGADEREVISRLDQLLDRYGCLGAYGRADQISFRFLTDELGELRAYGLILPTLFLCIVAFLLNVLLSRLVGTQRGQVAVLKAFGYTNVEIGIHYLELALVAVTAGTIAGVGLGLWLASGMMNIYARYFHFPALRLQVDARLILFAVAIAAGSACLGAISAVRRAVALAPAEAMRPEPPATFRPGLLERIGLRTLLAPSLAHDRAQSRSPPLARRLLGARRRALDRHRRVGPLCHRRSQSAGLHSVPHRPARGRYGRVPGTSSRAECATNSRSSRASFASNPIARSPRACVWDTGRAAWLSLGLPRDGELRRPVDAAAAARCNYRRMDWC